MTRIWMRIWATNHNALLRNGISIQPQNDYVYIMEQSKSITHGEQVDQSINQS